MAEDVMDYILQGVVALLVLFSLTGTILTQYAGIDFSNAPAGVEGAVGAVLTIFFILVLWKMYKDA